MMWHCSFNRLGTAPAEAPPHPKFAGANFDRKRGEVAKRLRDMIRTSKSLV
jgi:hypothetical protein